MDTPTKILLVAAGLTGVVVAAKAFAKVPSPPPSNLTTLDISVDNQALTIGQTANVSVVAHDNNGLPLAGVIPEIRAGSMLLETLPATSASGRTAGAIAFNQAGRYQMFARVMSLQSNPITITVTAAAPPPPTLAKLVLSADKLNIVAGDTVTFTLTAYDTSNQPTPLPTLSLYIGGTKYGTFQSGINSATLSFQFNSAGSFTAIAQ